MKKINKKTIIIMIIVAVIIIVIGLVLAIPKVQEKNYIEKGLWLEKEYPEVNTKEEALKTIKKVCSDCELTNDLEEEGLWFFKSEKNGFYYAFNNDIKVYSEFMTIEESKNLKKPLPEEDDTNNTEENR